MKKSIFTRSILHVIIICAVQFRSSYAQDPLLSLSIFSDNTSGTDNIISSTKSDDGLKIFLTGTSDISGNTDVFTIALALDGTELWRHTYGGINADVPKEVIYFNGYVYVMGVYNKISGTTSEYFLLKYAEETGYISSAVYTHFYNVELFDMAINSAGNIYVTGSSVHRSLYTESDIFTKALSGNDLTELHEHIQAGFYAAVGKKIVIDALDNVYVWGTIIAVSYGDKDCILIKLNSDLTTSLTPQIYQSYAGKNDKAIDAEISANGLYIYALAEGSDNTVSAEPHFALHKISTSTFVRTWIKRKGINLAGAYYPKDLLIGSNNYIYLTGQGAATNDIYNVAYRQNGTVLWESTKDFGFAEYGSSMCYENGDIYIAAYCSDNSLRILRYDGTAGTYVWPSENTTYAGTSALTKPSNIFSMSASEIYVTAADENIYTDDYLLLKYTDTAPRHSASHEKLITSIYPNPANNLCNIVFSDYAEKIEIINAQGEIVFEEKLYDSTEHTLNISSHADGMYFIKAYFRNTISIQPLSVIK
ncbi:MAG: T9SS type A sorting domain-containing protein [Fimbriimonadaceae bacterium]|nr:T9SS type A sorting domain-containing protein [Chitinophagales bacterium]